VLSSGTAELEPIVQNADKLLRRLDDWKLWRIAGKPFQIRAGGLKDQIEEEQDEIYQLESEFLKVAKANGKENTV
jgi:hypothetical protein